VDPSDPPKCDQQAILKLLLPAPKLRPASGKPSVIEQPQSGKIPELPSDGSAKFQWMIVSTPCSKSCGGGTVVPVSSPCYQVEFPLIFLYFSASGTRKNYIQCTETGRVISKISQKMDAALCDSEVQPIVALEETCNSQPCPQ
jgi:hypothetical protein